MADAITLGQTTDGGTASPTGHRRSGRADSPQSFQQALLRAFQGTVATGWTRGGVHPTVARSPATGTKPAASPPAASLDAPTRTGAAAQEGVPASWQPASR